MALFLACEVLDLGGSPLARRLVQPPVSSQPTVAETEGLMRHGALDSPDGLQGLLALGGLPPSPIVGWCPSSVVRRPGGPWRIGPPPRVPQQHASSPASPADTDPPPTLRAA